MNKQHVESGIIKELSVEEGRLFPVFRNGHAFSGTFFKLRTNAWYSLMVDSLLNLVILSAFLRPMPAFVFLVLQSL